MKILVLGITGMLGRVMYAYLRSQFPGSVFGTSREMLHVETAEKDLRKVFSRLKTVDYVINCIGLLKNEKDEKKLFAVNSAFPQLLSRNTQKFHYKLIHISTDDVFGNTAGIVTEKTNPNPDSIYGKSKLKGESIHSNVLSIRTSIIGFDPIHSKGLLEWAKNERSELYGYTNQLWSGATTLQVAMLCEKIIHRDIFSKIRDKTPIIHFSPIKNVTKYDILVTFFLMLGRKKVIKKRKNNVITRQLTSIFEKEMGLDDFTHDLKNSLKELMTFEKMTI